MAIFEKTLRLVVNFFHKKNDLKFILPGLTSQFWLVKALYIHSFFTFCKYLEDRVKMCRVTENDNVFVTKVASRVFHYRLWE